MKRIETLSAAQARRIALVAQGFGGARPAAVGPARLHAAMARMGALQIDSVNVFARSHYLPHYARLGPYDRDALDRMLFGRRARYVEYVAHEAALIPADDWALWRFRMDDFRARYGEWARAHAPTLDRLRAELSTRGAVRPSDLHEDAPRAPRGPWWDWDDVKRGLEMMWRFGEVAIAERRGFERSYALAERVVPAEALARDVSRADAILELVRRAARAYGVATASDLADYYRLKARDVAPALAQLAEAGELLPVRVAGWERGGRPLTAWLHRDAPVPRRLDRVALLTPFDPVVWFRDRALRMFGFDYRIEIYVPAHRRRFGYYSLPVLVGDRLAARVDLKADRAGSTLLVQSAWWEPDAPAEAAERIAAELRRAAAWQGLEQISVSGWGDASHDIAQALPGARRHDHPRAPLAPAIPFPPAQTEQAS
ncbi:winged helix-turn-helix domain-containing protein [Microbacterium sp. Marseille-Q6965]|uniref:winged helix-turn-helix domain-containing protein n=1 Tax=Microbacterium sp. Marseille-Q6965 TaxID=2965072 RepID=UPI0021B7181C|nr:crosslink repair DNA glycosylase YcaQ family protein [Microbacterium sp. Marseille-Q6965]